MDLSRLLIAAFLTAGVPNTWRGGFEFGVFWPLFFFGDAECAFIATIAIFAFFVMYSVLYYFGGWLILQVCEKESDGWVP